MSVNKVQLANGETIIDISDSTVTPETLAEGVTAHDASGQKITGKMVPGGGSSDGGVEWKNVTGKPFHVGGSDTLEWDGNTDGLVSVLSEVFKVSDAIPTMDDLANGVIICGLGDTVTIPPEEIVEADGFIMTSVFFVAPYDNFDASEIFEEDGPIFPESGVYMMPYGIPVTITIAGYNGFGGEKINSDALPKATNFYINSKDGYLYKSNVLAEDNRLTIHELKEAYYGGLKLILSLTVNGELLYDFYPEGMLIRDNALYCFIRSSNDSLQSIKFFTAEYVPESTT